MSKRLPLILTLNEFSLILKNTKLRHHQLAFKLSFFCGLRISEVLKLQSQDVDRSRGMLHIREGKGGKDRYVPYPRQLEKSLSGVPITKCGVRALEYAIKKSVKGAKINKDIHYHSLRHSSASYYLSKGMTLREVQQLLGHSRITTTGIYLHTSPEDVKKRMGDIWGE